LTNRESGLSALAAALTGYTPRYGLLEAGATAPNLEVIVDCALDAPSDYSILGDWIGMQRTAAWRMPYGPIPLLRGLPSLLSHEQRKALTAAAANYGCPLLYIDGISEVPAGGVPQATLRFNASDLAARYADLRPRGPVSLITIGCPQASIGELRAVAEALRGRRVTRAPGGPTPPLWVFTSGANKAIARQIGLADLIEGAGALLLEHTCPEVVPYDPHWVKQILTNSMKAEHYIKSGLNSIPTAVMTLADCIAVATGEWAPATLEANVAAAPRGRRRPAADGRRTLQTGPFSARGAGLPSQTDFVVRGEALVTDTPITLLGFVNRISGVIEEPGHPADGESMAGKIVIFPKGSGSTVAPYVLLELYYRGQAPLAIVNTEIDQQCAPACSLENIPYAYGFDADIIAGINAGDRIELRREGGAVTLRVLDRYKIE
jgi:predicted aconitase with swiveling domain